MGNVQIRLIFWIHFASLIQSNYLIINYKHHKCIPSGQPEYKITFRDKKIHETQIKRDQLNNTWPNSFVVGTGAFFHVLHLCPPPPTAMMSLKLHLKVQILPQNFCDMYQ